MKTIKIGLIGSGFVTHLHLNAFRQVVGIPVQVVAVASLDDDLDRFAKKFNIPTTIQTTEKCCNTTK